MNKGFSLLEMLVALVLLTGVGGAIYSLLNNQFVQLRRLDATQQYIEHQQYLLQWAQTLNPAKQPQGEQKSGDYTIRWQSTVTTPPLSSAKLPTAGTQGLYQTDLYRVTISLVLHGQVVTQLQTTQIGDVPLVNNQPYPPLNVAP